MAKSQKWYHKVGGAVWRGGKWVAQREIEGGLKTSRIGLSLAKHELGLDGLDRAAMEDEMERRMLAKFRTRRNSSEDDPNAKYKIVRMFQRGGTRVIKRGLTLEQAQHHCHDPQTSSRTAKGAKAARYTAAHGPWFDGYDVDKKKRRRKNTRPPGMSLMAWFRHDKPNPRDDWWDRDKARIAEIRAKKKSRGLPSKEEWKAAILAQKAQSKKVWNPARRKNWPKAAGGDQHAADHLEMEIVNDGQLYRQQGAPIIENLAKKMAKGVYDGEKAVKLWSYLADTGARKYGGANWSSMYTVATRKLVGAQLRMYYDEQVRDRAREIEAAKSSKKRRKNVHDDGEIFLRRRNHHLKKGWKAKSKSGSIYQILAALPGDKYVVKSRGKRTVKSGRGWKRSK